MKNDNYFFCYDQALKDYLHNNNIDFITHARAINSNREFWLFQSSSDLSRLIKEYKLLKSKNPKMGGKTTMVENTP